MDDDAPLRGSCPKDSESPKKVQLFFGFRALISQSGSGGVVRHDVKRVAGCLPPWS